ncbi:EF-Hand 1, calcium-binding site [Sesbania bispinosa]|nr:EF-Hand 1, calcium-binding site [Sesbania bispinosa]
MESSSGNTKRKSGEVLDGSNIMELVGNEKVFSNFVDHKFHQLDKDRDGKLSVKELEPAVADIGAALGLPAQGTSPDSDHIYYEVLNEFTHGKQEKVSKTEFKEVLSDILLGMAAGLKRDPIVILRMDGEDLLEFVNGPSYEAEMASMFSETENPSGSLRQHIIEAFGRLTVDRGIPPTSDSWVFNNIVDPALLAHAGPAWDKAVTQETFLEEFKKTLNSALENMPKDKNGKISKEYLQVALEVVSPSAGLPPVGAIEEMDKVISEAFKMVNADDKKMVNEEEFKKILTEILGSIMLQLEGNPIAVVFKFSCA